MYLVRRVTSCKNAVFFVGIYRRTFHLEMLLVYAFGSSEFSQHCVQCNVRLCQCLYLSDRRMALSDLVSCEVAITGTSGTTFYGLAKFICNNIFSRRKCIFRIVAVLLRCYYKHFVKVSPRRLFIFPTTCWIVFFAIFIGASL